MLKRRCLVDHPCRCAGIDADTAGDEEWLVCAAKAVSDRPQRPSVRIRSALRALYGEIDRSIGGRKPLLQRSEVIDRPANDAHRAHRKPSGGRFGAREPRNAVTLGKDLTRD